MSLAETQQLAVKLTLDDRFSGGIKAAQASLKGFDTQVGKLASKIGKDLSNGLGQAIKNVERLGVAGAGLAIGAGAAAIKWAGDFEAQLNTINTIAMTTPEALSQIGDGIRDVAKKTGLSLDDLTSSYYDLLSAGVKTADAQSLLNDAVTLGIGGLATTQQTVDLLTTAYNAYGLSADGAAKATDMFAQAVADGKVTAAQIAETFSNVASVAKAYGVGIDQIAASYGYLTAQGVAASEVTTEMQRAIISLIKPLPALEVAQKKLKINFTDEIRTKGLIPALQELRDYSDKTKVPLIELLGRVEAVKFTLQTTGSQEGGFLAELDKINSSTGEAAKQAAERQQGFNYQLSVFKALVKDAGITIGDALLPQLTPMVKQLDDFINNNQGGIKKFGADLANTFRDIAAWVSKLDFKQIGDDFKVAGQFAHSIVQAFIDAPPWVQEFLTVGFVANKFTGGAVQAIIGDLAGGLIKGILGINAGVVNITAGVVNGPGGVGALGEAGAAAGGVGLFTVALSVGTIAAIGLAFWSAMQQAPDVVTPANGGTPGQAFSRGHGFGPVSGHDQRGSDTSGGSALGSIAHQLANTLGDTHDETSSINRAVDASYKAALSWDTQSEKTGIRLGAAAEKLAEAGGLLAQEALSHIGGREGVAGRSKLKFKKDPSDAAVDNTFQHDLIHSAKMIARSDESAERKIADLKILAKAGNKSTKDAIGDLEKKIQPPIVTVNVTTQIGPATFEKVAIVTRRYGPVVPQ